MRVRQIITDYVPKSILTAWGQMIARGEALPEAIAQGGLNHYLKSKGVGAPPIFEAIDYSDWAFKLGNFVLVDTPQTISGVGFQPVLVLFLSVDSTDNRAVASIGWDSVAFHNCIYQEQLPAVTPGFWRLSEYTSIALVENTISKREAYISSMTGDGFIITSSIVVWNVKVTYLALYWNAGVP